MEETKKNRKALDKRKKMKKSRFLISLYNKG